MSKLFFAALLLILSVLPNSANKTVLIGRIENTLNRQTKADVTRATTYKYQTVEITENFKRKAVVARSAYFIDLKSGQILYQKNPDKRLPMASITKLMTAIIVLETTNPDEIVTVKKMPTHSGDAAVGLVPGDRLTVEELLSGLLITSGSDAALNLADYVSGSQSEFVTLMNKRAISLGLNNTKFSNPVGWDDTDNYSSAHDLAILSKVALSNPALSKIVSKKSAQIKSEAGRPYILTNTNLLLDNKHYLGTKTGTTFNAGECLATYYKDTDKELIGVILNSPERFPETREIIRFINQNYHF